MEREIELFNNYTNNFNPNTKGFKIKYKHSFLVMEHAKKIAISENMNDKDIYIATLCGLLHDIARFKQWDLYNTFIDDISFDHGDEGANILKDEIVKYTDDKEIQEIVILAVKYHNKFNVPEYIDKYKRQFINITRDADKIDIMEYQGLVIDDDINLNPDVLKSIFNKEQVRNQDVFGNGDSILRTLAWVFDLNYNYSFKYIKEKKIIEKKINLLKEHFDNEVIEKLYKMIMEEMKGR